MKLSNLKSKNDRLEKILKSKIIITVIIGIVIFLVCIKVENIFKEEVYIYFFDVGQGDASLIEDTGVTYLIDSGGSKEFSEKNNTGNRIILPFLLDNNIRNIDYAIVTHFHYDHVKGLLELLDKIKIRKVIIPKVYLDISSKNLELYDVLKNACKKQGIPIIYMKQGDFIKSKHLKISCVYPFIKSHYNENENNNSLILLVNIMKKFTVLYTGDAEIELEDKISKCLGKVNVLKVPHHGSSTSSSKGFLNRIKPEYAICSVGKNKYGHPNKEVIYRYKNIGTKFMTTKQNGMIKIIIDKEKIKIK